jgi:hypothetical protein
MKFGSITTPIVTDGLVFNADAANRASYPKSGTTVTDTVDNNNGTISAATFSDVNKGVFSFDGTDDYIDFGNILNFERTDSFSIECWFKRDRSGVSEFLVAKQESSGNNRGYTFLLDGGDNKLTVVIRNNTASSGRIILDSTTSITDTNWHCGVFTYDGSSNVSGIKIYLNGLENNGSAIGTLSATIITSTPLQIGARNDGNSFDGNIGPVHIYNRALSASEVLHNYTALKSRFGL